MEEKRKYIRVDDTIKVWFRIIEPPAGHGTSLSKNISEGGIALLTNQQLEKGTVLELWINLKEMANPIIATGKVAWLKDNYSDKHPFLVGIKFIKISPSDYDKFKNYLRKKLAKANITIVR